MKQYWTILLASFFFGGTGALQAQSQSVIERRMANSSAAENEVFSLAFNNPAMKSLWHSETLTELQVGGEYKKEDLPSVIQEGKGLRMGNVDVSSYIRNKKNTLWGRAYYKNGKKLDRLWNETSDYEMLYPYVMGDTLGGSLKSEQYFFSGGYAYNNSKYLVGVEGSYRASIEYRNADPRPKNLTGDLRIHFGAARYLGKNYVLGVSLSAQKYKQTNDLAFYNEMGVPNIFHFTGLGTDYYRFRGAKGESFYKGHAFGGSLELLPATGAGASAAIRYNNFQFDKVISSLNELPMAGVKEDQLSGELAWKEQRDAAFTWGVQGTFDYTRRVGSENIFGAATGNIFPQIGSQKRFMNKIYAGEISSVLEYTSSGKWRFALLPEIGYTQLHTTYLHPSREMKVGFFHESLNLRASRMFKQWLIGGELGYFNKFSSTSSLDIAGGQKAGEERLNEPIVSNYSALKARLNGINARIRSDYSWNGKQSVYLSVNYQYSKDQRHSQSQYIGASLGLAF